MSRIKVTIMDMVCNHCGNKTNTKELRKQEIKSVLRRYNECPSPEGGKRILVENLYLVFEGLLEEMK